MKQTSGKTFRIPCSKRCAAFALGRLSSLCAVSNRNRGPDLRTARDVLIIEPFGMGDLISCEPLIRALTDGGYRVHLSANPVWRDLFDEGRITSWVESQVPWASYDAERKYPVASLFGREFRELRAALRALAGSAIAIDPRGDIRSVALLASAGFGEVITFSHYVGSDMPLPDCAARKIPAATDIPKWRLNLRFLDALGVACPDGIAGPRIGGGAPWSSGARTVGLIPVAPWQGRCWKTDKWQRLADELHSAGYETIGLCGPGQKQAASSFLGDRAQLRECAGVREWINELKKLRAVVTVETGPMHLAAGLGVPLVALAGPGVLPLWAPPGKWSRIIQHQDGVECAPCHQVGECVRKPGSCMALISAEETLQCLLGLLKETNQ